MKETRNYVVVKQLRAKDLRVGDVARIAGQEGWLVVVSAGIADNGHPLIAWDNPPWFDGRPSEYKPHELFDVQAQV